MNATSAIYDEIGKGYRSYRWPDPRITGVIHSVLGAARTILNVGAGAGTYEPVDRDLIALERSSLMIAQRPVTAAPVVQGDAVQLPFADKSFDATLAVLTIHHWPDCAKGLAELKRVSKRVVILTWDPVIENDFWLTRDYFPEIIAHDQEQFPTLSALEKTLGRIEVRPVLIPHDCTDGFLCAYWRRPEMYLDESARTAISAFARLGDISDRVAHLRYDLTSGEWRRRNESILHETERDFAYRLIVADTA